MTEAQSTYERLRDRTSISLDEPWAVPELRDLLRLYGDEKLFTIEEDEYINVAAFIDWLDDINRRREQEQQQ